MWLANVTWPIRHLIGYDATKTRVVSLSWSRMRYHIRCAIHMSGWVFRMTAVRTWDFPINAHGHVRVKTPCRIFIKLTIYLYYLCTLVLSTFTVVSPILTVCSGGMLATSMHKSVKKNQHLEGPCKCYSRGGGWHLSCCH
jgi:hypothetical protein